MSDYRLYLLDQKMKIFQFREVACNTDADAVSEAYGMTTECHAVEIWTGPRMVARVNQTFLHGAFLVAVSEGRSITGKILPNTI